jgi:hypothetical protein
LREGRLSGRRIGPGRRLMRNLAFELLRALGDRFVVEGFGAFSAWPDRGLSLLIRRKP